MYTEKSDLYFCKKLRVLEHLHSKGFEPFANTPDKYYPGRTIWIFRNDPLLYAAVEDYFSKREKEKASEAE